MSTSGRTRDMATAWQERLVCVIHRDSPASATTAVREAVTTVSGDETIADEIISCERDAATRTSAKVTGTRCAECGDCAGNGKVVVNLNAHRATSRTTTKCARA